jgi:hypothetical protein
VRCDQWRQSSISKRFSTIPRQCIHDALQQIGDPTFLAKNLRIMTNLGVWVSTYSPQCDETDGGHLQACFSDVGVSV